MISGNFAYTFYGNIPLMYDIIFSSAEFTKRIWFCSYDCLSALLSTAITFVF